MEAGAGKEKEEGEHVMDEAAVAAAPAFEEDEEEVVEEEEEVVVVVEERHVPRRFGTGGPRRGRAEVAGGSTAKGRGWPMWLRSPSNTTGYSSGPMVLLGGKADWPDNRAWNSRGTGSPCSWHSRTMRSTNAR